MLLLLLLPLLTGSLTLCAGQSNPVRNPATLQTTADSLHNNVALLLTAVQSTRALNETTLAPVLSKLHDIIQGMQPDVMFSLSLKNYTRV